MIDLNKLKENWPSPFVSRDRIYEFTHGLFKQNSLSTFDSGGRGITTRYRIGRRVFYKVDDVIAWMRTKNADRRI